MVYVFIYFHSDFIEMRKNTEYMPKNKSLLDDYFKTVIDIFVRVNYELWKYTNPNQYVSDNDKHL